MSESGHLKLAARFVAALYDATRGRRGNFRSALIARSALGSKPPAERTLAWMTAERAGFLVAPVWEPTVMLTEQGCQALQPAAPGRR